METTKDTKNRGFASWSCPQKNREPLPWTNAGTKLVLSWNPAWFELAGNPIFLNSDKWRVFRLVPKLLKLSVVSFGMFFAWQTFVGSGILATHGSSCLDHSFGQITAMPKSWVRVMFGRIPWSYTTIWGEFQPAIWLRRNLPVSVALLGPDSLGSRFQSMLTQTTVKHPTGVITWHQPKLHARWGEIPSNLP